MLKDQILELRQQGKTYDQIALILGCSKSSVCYHCAPNQKDKFLERQRKNRSKQHPYKRKIEEFSSSNTNKNNNKAATASISHLFFLKLHEFSKSHKEKTYMYNQPTFTIEDVIQKFGQSPTCYLTGEPIDISKPRTYHFDHIIPRSRGGDNSIDNLGICSKKANQSKQDMTPDEFVNLCKQVLEHNGYQVSK
jgi:CRISPR/Cas system Type II protein with McrA/HNH and RuvC-like nuclease domain